DGYLELEYDFTTPAQAQDFQAASGTPKILDNSLYVADGPDSGDRIALNAPMADLRSVDLQIRLVRRGNMPGFRLGFIHEGEPLGAKMGVFIGFDPASVRLYRAGEFRDFIETFAPDLPLSEDVTLSGKSNDGRFFNWTFNGKAIGGAQAPDNMR